MLGTLSGIFYVGNIYGSVISARVYNRHVADEFLATLSVESYRIDCDFAHRLATNSGCATCMRIGGRPAAMASTSSATIFPISKSAWSIAPAM